MLSTQAGLPTGNRRKRILLLKTPLRCVIRGAGKIFLLCSSEQNLLPDTSSFKNAQFNAVSIEHALTWQKFGGGGKPSSQVMTGLPPWGPRGSCAASGRAPGQGPCGAGSALLQGRRPPTLCPQQSASQGWGLGDSWILDCQGEGFLAKIPGGESKLCFKSAWRKGEEIPVRHLLRRPSWQERPPEVQSLSFLFFCHSNRRWHSPTVFLFSTH